MLRLYLTRALCLLWLLLLSSAALAQNQSTTGDCSPNVSGVEGDVDVNCQGLSFRQFSRFWLMMMPEQWVMGSLGTATIYDASGLLEAAFPEKHNDITCGMPTKIPSFVDKVKVEDCRYEIEFVVLPLGLETGTPARVGETFDERTTVPICGIEEECIPVPVSLTFHNALPPRPFNMTMSPDPVPDNDVGRLSFSFRGGLVPEGISCVTTPEIGKPGRIGQKFLFLEEYEKCKFTIFDLGEKYAKSKVSFVDRLGREIGLVFVEDSGL